MIFAKAEGKPYDRNALSPGCAAKVVDVVRRQAACGIDSVNDGEVQDQFHQLRARAPHGLRDARLPAGGRPRAAQHHRPRTRGTSPVLRRRQGSLVGAAQRRQLAVCVASSGTWTHRAREDLQNFKAALVGVKAAEAFLPANTPGTIEHWLRNEYYPSDEAFVEAIAEAMRDEYEAIVAPGFLLQIDDPTSPTAGRCTRT